MWVIASRRAPPCWPGLGVRPYRVGLGDDVGAPVAKGETGALERSPAAFSSDRVTLAVGDAYTAPGPLSLVWCAALASGRPVGAFTPRTRFHSIIYDGTVYPEVQRRALADLERHIVDHEAALLVLAAAERLVEGGFAEGWDGCGLDATALARRLVISIRALTKRNRVAALVSHGDYAASRGFSDRLAQRQVRRRRRPARGARRGAEHRRRAAPRRAVRRRPRGQRPRAGHRGVTKSRDSRRSCVTFLVKSIPMVKLSAHAFRHPALKNGICRVQRQTSFSKSRRCRATGPSAAARRRHTTRWASSPRRSA